MENQELLKKIAQNVLLKSGFASELGLAQGKMGMILFLMHYARLIDNELYEEYAGLLLDDIYTHLSGNLPINMENGLCGIGWGTEYLLQNRFVEGEADEVLGEIDRIIMERNPVRVSDFSLETGLAGIFEYVLIRIRSSKTLKNRFLFDKDYLEAIEQAAIKVLKEVEEEVCRERAELLIAGLKRPTIIPERKIFDVVHVDALENVNLWQRTDGLRNGNAGVGLKMILG